VYRPPVKIDGKGISRQGKTRCRIEGGNAAADFTAIDLPAKRLDDSNGKCIALRQKYSFGIMATIKAVPDEPGVAVLPQTAVGMPGEH
jgi:hypothetical protein